MSLFTSDIRPTEITTVVVLISLLFLLTPLPGLWFSTDSAWYLPYLIWFGISLCPVSMNRWQCEHG
ncbi:MAG: hypothetical protein WBO58_06635 [Gammaproteobacteria bacterium]